MLNEQEPIKYGDVFDVSGDLASKPITWQDAATMQSAENIALGKTQKGGPASVMQSAAEVNERLGVDLTDMATDEGVTVSETDVGTRRIVVEAVGDQVVGQYAQPATEPVKHLAPEILGSPVITGSPIAAGDALEPGSPVTIGEALEASAIGAGDKPVDQSDAAAIQAAEVRATGYVLPGGIGAAAQSAATHNLRSSWYEEKTTIADVLEDATTKLPADKPATSEDAEGVINAEMKNKPMMGAYPGGVADSVAAAARLNMQ